MAEAFALLLLFFAIMAAVASAKWQAPGDVFAVLIFGLGFLMVLAAICCRA